MEFSETRKQIQPIMHGVIPLNKCPEYTNMTAVFKRISDPPSYYVYLTLIEICKFPKQTPHEKSVWQICLSYKDTIFCIEDWKRYAWKILALGKSDVSAQIAKELHKKVISATGFIIKKLEREYNVYIHKNEFYIPNNANKIQSMYKFFEKKVKYRLRVLQKESKTVNQKTTASIIERLLNKINEKHWQLFFFTGAAIVFFFSYIELVLDASFALLKHEDADYITFKEKAFKDRFKYIFNISKNKNLAIIYNDILRLKEYRDCVVHGFGDKEALLVELPRMGLVPVSWEKSKTSIASTSEFIPFDEESALWICKTMRTFEKWLNSTQSTKMVLRYLESAFPIPIAKKRRKEIKDHMQNYDIFHEYLVDLALAVDAYEDSYYPF